MAAQGFRVGSLVPALLGAALPACWWIVAVGLSEDRIHYAVPALILSVLLVLRTVGQAEARFRWHWFLGTLVLTVVILRVGVGLP